MPVLPSAQPLNGTAHRFVRVDDARGLPVTVKILLEGVRRVGGDSEQRASDALARYPGDNATVPFRPSRILLQDYTGVPAAVDLAAMRAAMQRAGKDPAKIEPLIPVDLIIDHSVQADFFGAKDVYERNLEREYERNRERYAALRWAGQAFKTFRVVPPGAGICHQVNLERLSQVVVVRDVVAMPDTLFGADSHTTMVNGLGVLGWGVGGIEAEAAMLGQPTFLPWPVVVGVRLHGALPTGTTATDLVLTLTELFRKHGVVDKFIEFAGDGLSSLAVAEPRRPQDGVDLPMIWDSFPGPKPTKGIPVPGHTEGPKPINDAAPTMVRPATAATAAVAEKPRDLQVSDGSVVIAAITSCTNTSNPSVMIAAGLLAKKAVERGLKVKPHVKTTFAPGSRVVTRYLEEAGLTPYLEQLGFYLVGFGCTVCIGNSGPLATPEIEQEVKEHDLNVVSVLSGNRNFEGRIHPLIKSSSLASPPLVVAYALAGTVHIDLHDQPIGDDKSGKPVFLKDLWPTPEEVNEVVGKAITQEMYATEYGKIFDGDRFWKTMPSPTGLSYQWDPNSTYVQEPPFFQDFIATPPARR